MWDCWAWTAQLEHENVHMGGKNRVKGFLHLNHFKSYIQSFNPAARGPLSQGRMETKRGVYLFCDQEVIAQSFSGADGPQEEGKDQIQEPPAGHQQYTTHNC